MINMSFSSACLFYLLLTLGALFAVGLYAHFKKKDRLKLETNKIFICEYCQHAYLDDIDLHVSACPQCRLLNKIQSSGVD